MEYLVVLFVGIVLGMVIMWFLMRGELGDEYDIKKSKVRGRDNTQQISQQVEPKEKKRFRLFKRKNK